MRWVCRSVLLLLSLALPLGSVLAEEPPAIPFSHEPAFYLWRGGFSRTTSFHDALEMTVASPLGDGTIVFEHPLPPPVGILNLEWSQDEEGVISYYNFRGVLLLLSFLTDNWLSGDTTGREHQASRG